MGIRGEKLTDKIIVGLGKANHDSSLCFSKNGKLTYIKYERDSGIKQGRAPETWYWKKLLEYGIQPNDIDHVIETFPCEVGYVPRLPNHGLHYFKFPHDEHYILDHHLAHVWSHTDFKIGEQAVVIDGRGSGNYRSLIIDEKNMHRSAEQTPANVFALVAQTMGLQAKQTHGDAAGKLMGLIQYGKIDNELYKKFMKQNSLNELINYGQLSWKDTIDDVWLSYLRTMDEVCWEHVKTYFKTINKDKDVYYSGGVALNIEWNQRLKELGYKLKMQPHVYDGGLSVGCVRWMHYFLKLPQPVFQNFPYVQEDEAPKSEPTLKTIHTVAKALADKKIVAWYQGHGEIGPRALGNRSILMHPDIEDGKELLNEKVKHREWWRPYGASYLYGHAEESPYMLFTKPETKRSITHVDGTTRHQTVRREDNFYYWKLIDYFYELTGIPCVLNTSLNLKGKPIAATINGAKEIFKESENIDLLCIGDDIYDSVLSER